MGKATLGGVCLQWLHVSFPPPYCKKWYLMHRTMKKRPGLLREGGEESCAWLFQKAQAAGHLKMVAFPTSARLYRPQTLNALIVKCFVPLCLLFFSPLISSTAITCFTGGCTRIYRFLEIQLAILRQISLINELLNSKVLCSSIEF